MRKRFLAFFLATSLCLGSSMTVFAAEATTTATISTTSYDTGQRQVAYETNATRLQLDTIRSLFNAKEYAAMYPDVVKELGNNEEALWNHFVTYGFSEGRSMNKSFNVFAYRACYEDLQKAFGNNLFAYYEHYIQFGQNEHRTLITIDAAKKAGITVIGMNGKDLTNPNSSLSGSLTKGVKPKVTPKPRPSASASPKASATPKATATPTPSASPSASPSATPTPGVHDHDYALVRSNGDGTHTFSCSICGLKDPDRTNVACTYGSPVGKNGGHSSYCIVCNYQTPVEPCTQEYIPVEDTTEDGNRVEKHTIRCLVCHTYFTDSEGNTLENECIDNDNNGECDYCKGTVEKKHVHEYGDWTKVYEDSKNWYHAHQCILEDCKDLNKGYEVQPCTVIYTQNEDNKTHKKECAVCGRVVENEECTEDPDNLGHCIFCKSEIVKDSEDKTSEGSGNSSTDPDTQVSNDTLISSTEVVNEVVPDNQENVDNPDNPDNADAGDSNGENNTPSQNEDQSDVNSDSGQESGDNQSDLGDQSGSNSNESIETPSENSTDDTSVDESMGDSGTDTGETFEADGNGDGGTQDTVDGQSYQVDLVEEPIVDTSPT